MDYAFSFIMSHGGLHKEEDYPYVMQEGTCEEKKDESQVVTISGYHDVPKNSEESLLKALANQPVSISISASGRDFQFYSGGVFDGYCGLRLRSRSCCCWIWINQGVRLHYCKEFLGIKMGRKRLHQNEEKYWQA